MNKMCCKCKKRKVCKYIDVIDTTIESLSFKMDDDIFRIAFKCLYREENDNGNGSHYFSFGYNIKCGYN